MAGKKFIKKELDLGPDPGDINEYRKKRIMWISIACIMALVFMGWFLNLKNIFKISEAKNPGVNIIGWDEMKGEFNKTVGNTKDQIKELKKQEALQELKNNLEQVIETASSTESVGFENAGTSTLPKAEDVINTSTINNF